MADHIYEIGVKPPATGAAAAPIAEIIPATLAAGKRPAEIRELGIFNNSGVAAEVGIGRPAAIGVTPGTLLTVQAADSIDTIVGATQVAASWGTAPTAPGNPMRRAEIQAVVGAGLIWVWQPGEFVLWSGSAISTIVLWQFSALAVTYDMYLKVAE